jgi:hypothetical protein
MKCQTLGGGLRRYRMLVFVGGALFVAVCAVTFTYICTIPSMPAQVTSNLLRELKKTTNPAELQQWASGVLHRTASSTNLPNGQVPKELQAVSVPGLHCEVLVEPISTNSCVLVYWGGGFVAPFGLAIGEPGFVPTQLESVCQIKWQDGVYVYYSK